jgi:transposase
MSKMPHHKGIDYKESAVQYYLQIKNQVKTCEIFGCSERSLMRWVKRYQETGKVVSETNKNRTAYKVTKEQVKTMLNGLKKDHQITMVDLHAQVKHEHSDFNITKQHMGKVIRDNNQTMKRVKERHKPIKRFNKPINIEENIATFYNTIKKYDINDIICIDETSLKSSMRRNYCRSKIGSRCTRITTSQEVFKKYTGIFAISTKGCEGWEVYPEGGITSSRMVEFYEKYLSQHKNKLIVMDNASSHRNPIVKATVNKNNTLLLSVPYQHFTNSIENWFSMFKSHLRKEPSLTYDDIVTSIPKALKRLKPESYVNIMKGTYERKKEYQAKDNSRYLRKPKKYKEIK